MCGAGSKVVRGSERGGDGARCIGGYGGCVEDTARKGDQPNGGDCCAPLAGVLNGGREVQRTKG